MNKQYVEKINEEYWISGKRISLDSIVYPFRRGQSAESINRAFPLLALEEIYGAIAFYLANQAEIDNYLKLEERNFELDRQVLNDPKWQAKMNAARQKLLARQI